LSALISVSEKQHAKKKRIIATSEPATHDGGEIGTSGILPQFSTNERKKDDLWFGLQTGLQDYFAAPSGRLVSPIFSSDN
jgi:DNA polymerase III psi subunit